MLDPQTSNIIETLGPNLGMLFMILLFWYKDTKDKQKRREVESDREAARREKEAEKESKRREAETNRLIEAHSSNYNMIQVTLNDFLEEFVEMRKDLEIVKTDQKTATKERTEMLKVLQKHDINFTKLQLKIENFDLRNQLGEKSA